MTSVRFVFREVARWTDVRTKVRTSVSGRGHPEPRKRRRHGSKRDRIEVRSSKSEKSRWQREADGLDLSLSEFLRIKLNDGKVRIATCADPALLEELRRQGNNFNQLMHAVHAGFPIAASRIEDVMATLQDLYRKQIRMG